MAAALRPPLPMAAPHYQQRGYSDPSQDVDVEQLLATDLAMPSSSGAASGAAAEYASMDDVMNNNNNNFVSVSAQQHYSSLQQKQQQSAGAAGGLADPNRAQNVALKVQLAASERELAQCRHALDLALVKSGNWSGMKHRVQLAKPLNPAPLKQWGTAGAAAGNGATSASGSNVHSSESSRASFVISSLQSQLREKEEQLNRANDTIQELSQQLKKQQQVAAIAAAHSASSGVNSNNGGGGGGALQQQHQILGSQQEASNAMTAHLMAQMRFLHSEVERYERALKEQRENDSRDTVDRGSLMARELQQRDAKIAALSTQLATLKSKLTPLQKAALHNTKEGESSPMELLTRIGQLEHDLGNAVAARNDALNDKYGLQAKCRKLEEKLREHKSKEEDIQQSAVGEVMASAQQLVKIREELARVCRERDNLHAMVEMRRAKDQAAKRGLMSSETQTEHKVAVSSLMQTDPTERPKASVFCQVEAVLGMESSLQQQPQFPPLNFLPPGTSASMTPAHTIPQQQQQQQQQNRTSPASANNTSSAATSSSSSANSDALSLAHALELKCAELDNVRARLEEQALQLERSNLALKQTRDTLNAELEVRRSLDAEAERGKAQVRTLQQTVSQLHVLLRDRDSALDSAQERAEVAHTDSVKLAAERQNWQRQLAANAHDLEQLLAQNSTAAQQVAHASSENEALREEVSRLLQREAQLSHALRAKDSELAEILASYQQCVQENEASMQAAKSLDRECQTLRGAIQMREERIVELQREVQALHQREEQLTTDLQACDYENGLLQRRIVQSETQQQSAAANSQELEHQIVAHRRLVTEFERAQAELHKQLIFKDNEALLLRKRCEQVEHECTVLTTQHNVERHKLRELEDANARLQVSGLMSQLAHSPSAQAAESRAREASKSRQSMDELAQRNGFLARQLEVKDGAIAQLQQQIAEERKNVELLRAALSEKAVQLEQCQRSMAELKKLVTEQARTLANAGMMRAASGRRDDETRGGASDSEQ